MLYDHYKGTYQLILNTIASRNRFFLLLFGILVIQILFVMTPNSINNIIVTILLHAYNVDISSQMISLQSVLWLLVLYFSIRYCQSVVYLERQYIYIHKLEATIATMGKIKFDREGADYLSHYPILSNFIDYLYKLFFPIVYFIIIGLKIYCEIVIAGTFLIVDTLFFTICVILFAFYLYFIYYNCMRFIILKCKCKCKKNINL